MTKNSKQCELQGSSNRLLEAQMQRVLLWELAAESTAPLWPLFVKGHSDQRGLQPCSFSKIRTEVQLTTLIETFTRLLKEVSGVDRQLSRLTLGNIKARLRMSILYSFANEQNLLVAGTGDRSESLVGYFTKFGDGAADFFPIGHLYKTEVRRLARSLGVPQ